MNRARSTTAEACDHERAQAAFQLGERNISSPLIWPGDQINPINPLDEAVLTCETAASEVLHAAKFFPDRFRSDR
jgi:hypothetical protein